MSPEALAAVASVIFAGQLRGGESLLELTDLVRVSVLRACGCTCHNPTGPPCWHTVDLSCPVHPAAVSGQ